MRRARRMFIANPFTVMVAQLRSLLALALAVSLVVRVLLTLALAPSLALAPAVLMALLYPT